MTKAEARKIYREKRVTLSDKEVLIFQDLLLIRFQELDLPYINLIHTYLPIYENNEPDPAPLIDWLRFTDPGMRVTYASIDPSDLSMKHFLQQDDMIFKANQYGIPEPVAGTEIAERDIDIALIPLLAYDKHGNRVGYGKGYYDRFIAKCREDVIKIGLSFFPPVETIEDVDFFDKKLDFCITPDCVYAF
ncbi:MAG: 5-formyltetrahydrofolate cyclo-ligase [bacterium]|jgi:5-formyltetrahydrofolate cyclo-ligase